MKKITGWNEIQEAKTFTKLPAGGYVVAIKDIKDVSDKEYLDINYDIIQGDYKNYWQKQYDNNTYANKRFGGRLIRSYKQTALSMFKSFITSVEKSNKGFKWDFDEQKLKNKKFGVIIAYEEYLTNAGKVRERPYVAQVHSVERIESGDFEVPELKKLNVTQTTTVASIPSAPNPFTDSDTNPFGNESSAPFDVEEENPFL